jgi:hypothetical protein
MEDRREQLVDGEFEAPAAMRDSEVGPQKRNLLLIRSGISHF